MERVKFNENWAETSIILSAKYANKLSSIMRMGAAEMVQQIKAWADEYENKYGDVDYDEKGLDYLIELERFGDAKFKNLVTKHFTWDRHAAVNLMFISAYYQLHLDDMFSQKAEKLLYKAMMFTLYERNNFINYDDPEQPDFETTITKWLENNKE